ncbi:hypothetical protein LR48_Vigan10g171900 [Vigna angularis]|uniref:Uncharacterized protein n=1 Tax=Phaseolus angularis TaxID=3914 RepID=A0A0L9VLN8_PHAAN|nr:hypothetical protein LR48_Vigan10g171900 [Vigna angularis]
MADILENWNIPNDERIRKKILSHIAVRWRDFKTRMTRVKRIAAQQRQILNDTPHVLSRGGYALLEKKMRKRRVEELGLVSADLAPPPARHELWKAARTKSNGQMTSQFAQEISQRIDELVEQMTQGTFVAKGREGLLVVATGRLDCPGRVRAVEGANGLRDYFGLNQEAQKSTLEEKLAMISQQQQQQQQQQEEDVYHPTKKPMPQPVNEAHEEAEDDDDPLSILTSRLNKLRKGPIELEWELRTFGLECHIPLYIAFNNAFEIIGGETMLNISCIQLWCMCMDIVVVESSQALVYGFLEPQTIQPSGNTLESRKSYMQTWITKSKREMYKPYIDAVMASVTSQ